MAPKQIFKFIDAARIYLDSCSRGKAETISEQIMLSI
jgi:hypothetical protein